MSTGSATSSLASQGPIVPASHRSGSTSFPLSILGDIANQVSSYLRGIQRRETSVRAVTAHGIDSATGQGMPDFILAILGSVGSDRSAAPVGYAYGIGCLLACLLACRGLVEGLGSFRSWSQLSGELRFSDMRVVSRAETPGRHFHRRCVPDLA